MRRKALEFAFPKTIPVMAGYVFLGITYGILMSTKGLPWWLPIVTALVIYTGSMEFLMTDILLSSFNPVSAFVTALMVGARHLFYGISMLHKYSGTGTKKFYLIFATSDETFAVNYSEEIPEGMDKGLVYLILSALDQFYWVFGAGLGGVLGAQISFNTKGLDFVMTAMFMTIFLNQWVKDGTDLKRIVKDHVSELIGVICSVMALMIFGPEKFIVPAMVLILLSLAVMRGWLEKEEGGEQE